MQELDQAPFGIVGLETALGLVVTRLIEPGHLDWPQAIEKMTINPARILGIDKGTLAIGADADVTVIDPTVSWTVDSGQVPLQEHQHAVRRLEAARPGRHGDRRRADQAPGCLRRPRARRAPPDACSLIAHVAGHYRRL